MELERRRAESLRPSTGLLRLVRLVRERLRRWPMAGSASVRGEEKRADLGRLAVSVPGGGVDVFLAKGLLRELRAKGRPLGAGAGALMVMVVVLIDTAGATDYRPDIVWGEGREGRDRSRVESEDAGRDTGIKMHCRIYVQECTASLG